MADKRVQVNSGRGPIQFDDAGLNPVRRAALRLIERAVGLPTINQVYLDALALDSSQSVVDRILDVLDVSYEVSEADLQRIPKNGRLIVVANHPLGGLEGIILASLLCATRPDSKIMANYMLSKIEAMKDLFIFVDPFDRSDSARRNIGPLKECIRWLKADHLLGCFPAGEVAHYDLSQRSVIEMPWTDTIAGLVRRTESPVLPVLFEGTNTALFHALGLLHPRVRTLMLPRQLLKKRGKAVQLHVGNPISFGRMKDLDDHAIVKLLRMHTFNLHYRKTDKFRKLISLPPPARKKTLVLQKVIDPIAPDALEAELRSIPSNQKLAESGGLEAWYGRAGQIPCILREIGRLREITFREVGEGTGLPLDLDEYDEYYVHLFLWNPEKREIAGAYRLGPTDEIVPKHGIRGLYTRSLFKYKESLLEKIDPALEMGRSFVCAGYQRSFTSLFLLWKGIARFVVQNPRYKNLFGPVSINDSYQSSSRNLLVSFLKMHNFLPDLAKLVKPNKPPRLTIREQMYERRSPRVVESMEDMEALIADIETEMKGIPILLKQYLKLGGKLLGFNVDPKFSYVCDGLILVNLTESDPKTIRKYMGEEGLESFLRYHRKHVDTRGGEKLEDHF
ncbi:MAG: lysophospholipid acyltransferase family protein [Verrucomicrobia bacterium]|nr:lysophospholipid acyltransferase family protein [Verrucomicrobiota bacterium]